MKRDRPCDSIDSAVTDPVLLEDAARRAADYLTHAANRRVAPSESDLDALRQLHVPFPEAPLPALDVIESLDRIGSPATVASVGGRYFGFVIGGALPACVAASWLAAAWDQNAALRVMSPAAAVFEDVALGWIRRGPGTAAGSGGAIRHWRDDGQPHRAWRPRATPCSRARAGTSKRTACSARRT